MQPSDSVILIVDDEPAIRELLETILEAEGHIVETVEDGTAALARIRSGSVDLVLLDVMLPEIDGLELCQRLRAEADPTAPHLPILMLSALGQLRSQEGGFAAGADDYITKPFDQSTLLARVQVWLRARGRGKSAHAALQAQLLARQAAEQRVVQAQLEAIRLAARELAQRVNNELVTGVGVLEMLVNEQTQEAKELAPAALDGMEEISRAIARLHELVRVETYQTPLGPALDLERSAPPDAS